VVERKNNKTVGKQVVLAKCSQIIVHQYDKNKKALSGCWRTHLLLQTDEWSKKGLSRGDSMYERVTFRTRVAYVACSMQGDLQI